MTRLFVAIDLPQSHKDEVAKLFTRLPGARWVPSEQVHLTLRFLGEVDDQGLIAVKAALSQVSFSAFPLTLKGVGHFPPGRYPRVLWVGVEPIPPLMRLYEDLEKRLHEAGFPNEERRFSPHVTLARLHGTPAASVEALETEHRAFHCPSFDVGEFILFSSVLSRTGAIHKKEAVYPAEMAPPSPS